MKDMDPVEEQEALERLRALHQKELDGLISELEEIEAKIAQGEA